MQFKIMNNFDDKTIGDIKSLLEDVDMDFVPRLSKKIEFDNYISKISKYAETLAFYDKNQLACILVMYANRPKEKKSYITLVAVKKEFRRGGLGKEIVKNALVLAKNKKFKAVDIETWSSNDAALKLYNDLGFEFVSKSLNKYGINKTLLRFNI